MGRKQNIMCHERDVYLLSLSCLTMVARWFRGFMVCFIILGEEKKKKKIYIHKDAYPNLNKCHRLGDCRGFWLARFFPFVYICVCGGLMHWQNKKGKVQIPRNLYKYRDMSLRMDYLTESSRQEFLWGERKNLIILFFENCSSESFPEPRCILRGG